MLVFLIPIWLHLWYAPYTKVEESFNLQATHDLLIHSPWNVALFDHNVYPGVVPRSFVGPLFLYGIAHPINRMFSLIPFIPDLSLFSLQILVRAILGFFVAYSLNRLRKAVRAEFGRRTAFFFVVLSLLQFHLPFYASRTLPNIFALVFTNLAFAQYIKAKHGRSREVKWFIGYLTFVCVVFRSEITVLALPLVLQDLLSGRMKFRDVFHAGLAALTASVSLTVLVDSYFWGKWLWPEFNVFFFNAILNKSSEWGTAPFHFYFSNLLLKIAPIAFPLSFFSLVAPKTRRILLPCLFYVFAYSFLPHKEWRFVLYVVPILNICAARVLVFLQLISNLLVKVLVRSLVLVAFAFVLLQHILSTHASNLNYPGAQAMDILHKHYRNQAYVHIDAQAAMNGVSLFLEEKRHLGWKYSKNETHTSLEDFIDEGYTNLITSNPDFFKGSFKVEHTVHGFDTLQVDQEAAIKTIRKFPILLGKPDKLVAAMRRVFHAKLVPKLYIMAREKLKVKA